MFFHYRYYIVISLKPSKVILQDENIISIFSMQDYATPMYFQETQHQPHPSTLCILYKVLNCPSMQPHTHPQHRMMGFIRAETIRVTVHPQAISQ